MTFVVRAQQGVGRCMIEEERKTTKVRSDVEYCTLGKMYIEKEIEKSLIIIVINVITNESSSYS